MLQIALLAVVLSAAEPSPVAVPGPAKATSDLARPDKLQVDLVRDGAVTGAALVAYGLSTVFEDDLAPTSCRWCTPDRFDRWARGKLAWGNTTAARHASDVGLVVVPAGAAAALAISSGIDGPRRRVAEDLVLVAESVTIAAVGTQVAKLSTARVRPYALEAQTTSVEDRTSFWSGHSAVAFSAATAAGTVARLRGYAQWPWILGVGLAGATTTAYLRVAGDRHWTTDVLAGAAWGSAVGVAVPMLHARRNSSMTLVPTGRGAVLTATF